ncbi:phasin family protein [Duganella sp. CF458]|uniref:TIGR01841 family phasin n=1 Tax=Duganella sp. CF458 TaxID=1884368 RepID=UPI0008EADBC6|nr:TIGR01841 family phasin [Duganella sp. CF458]SFF51065.1 phasin family protein [Duganella sp. CF458]
MFSIPEQFSAATKSQLEAQLKILNHFATTAFEGAQQVIALNLSTTKATVEKSSAAARELLEAKDPQEFFAKSSARVPSLDGLFTYNRELFSIASKTQTELFQAAQQQLKEAGKQAEKLPKLSAPIAAPAPVPAPAPAPAPAAPKAAKAEAKPVPKIEAKPEVVDSKPEIKAEAKVEAKADAKPSKPSASFPDPKAPPANGAKAHK